MTAKLVLGALGAMAAIACSVPVLAKSLDVAPGGGFYTARDVANESPRRMSHPFVGEPRAPSFVARGPHTYINRYEMGMTAWLNLHQLHRNGW
jgi:hypothetical protein